MVNTSSNCTWSSKDKTKEWQMEMLMEKLRSKANQYRSFQQCAKDLRMALLEKRYPIDSSERIQLQKCLDTLQQNIKVTTHQAMVERLESVSRQLGLKLVRPAPSGLDIFISSDMFYLEIVLEANGGVKDVKIHHEGRGEQSCEELVTCLSERNFADFTAQLEGLASIYQLNAEKKVKCKAFSALTSLETDLTTLASLHYIKDLVSVVHNSPVGLLEKRKGGHPMKLTYFVSPYDLLDPVTRTSREVTADTLNSVGQSVSVCMESSSAHKLQTSPIVTVTRTPDGNNWPVYGGLSASNSITVTGSFVLTLKRPIPVCVALVTGITAATGADCADISSPHPLLSLVTQVASGGKADSADNRGLFVNVGDQHHCYLMTEARGLDGVLVNSIPFTHPSHVPQVLACLRQQALFNTVIASCVRPSTAQGQHGEVMHMMRERDKLSSWVTRRRKQTRRKINAQHFYIEKMIMLEVMPLDWQHLSVTLEHPLEESMATVELDLTDVNNLTCKVYTSSGENTQANSEYATKVFQRSMSIPITMRSLIKLWNAQGQRMTGIYNGGGIGDPGGGGGGHQQHPSSDFDPDIKIKLEPGLGGLVSRHGSFASDQADPGFDSFSSSIDTLQFQDLGQSLGLIEGNVKRTKRKSGDSWQSPKRLRDDAADSSSSDSSPLGTPNSVPDNTPNLELSTITDLENSMSEKPREDLEIGEPLSVSELDVEEMFKNTVSKKPKKSREEKKSSSDILFDLGNKNLVPPSVSITPISSSQMNQNLNSVLSGMGLERRPGIEIIPISSTPTTSVPSSITITPISTKPVSEERLKERKSSKSRDEKVKLEKKRKRKKEDSPMGPPEKVPPKSDPLSKPVTVSIKPAESSSPRPSSPASSIRKYSTSPTHTSPLTVGKSSPSPSSKSSKQPTQSPKHSPHYSTSSPKNSLSSSPKHSTSSPKHQSSSGKPSMSTLKSAVSSPSKSDSKSKSKESRDKDRKVFSSSSGHSSPKMKSSSVKMKQLDISTIEGPQSLQSGGSTPPNSGDGGKPSSSSGQTRNRKACLSAIVDKLKSQHSDDGNGKEKKDKDRQVSSKVDGKSTGKPGENKPGEYMVKPSSDGMKLTINKTKSKDSSKIKSSSSSSSSSSSPSGSGSPKTHTGLKPGVNSGPASKKSHVSQKSSSPIPRSSSSSSSSSKSTTKLNMQKSSKPSGSPKMSDPNRVRDKPRIPKLSSFSGKNESRKLSPSTLREDENYIQLLGEGMVKQLDTKFQIPKLSARSSNPDEKKDKSERSELKDLDYANKIVSGSKNSEDLRVSLVDSKSKLSSSTTISLESSSQKLGPVKMESESPNISIIPMASSSEKEYKEQFEESVYNSLKLELPISALTYAACELDEKKKARLQQPCSSEEAAEMLIDFSTKESKLLPNYPASPSVSVHIMKSPVPPDRPHISPHSSPGITDDELMDEALVGNCK